MIKILLIILFLPLFMGTTFLILTEKNTQLSATTIAVFDNNNFSWNPSCFDAGEYDIMFTASDGSASSSETITITVNETCIGTLEDFCKLWLNPSANFKHYAIWANKYKEK